MLWRFYIESETQQAAANSGAKFGFNSRSFGAHRDAANGAIDRLAASLMT